MGRGDEENEMNWEDTQAAIDAAAKRIEAEFGAEFGLSTYRTNPNTGEPDRFRVSRSASFCNFSTGAVTLYTERLCEGDKWLDFCKGSEAEVARYAYRLDA
jgi:hypothetical protein